MFSFAARQSIQSMQMRGFSKGLNSFALESLFNVDVVDRICKACFGITPENQIALCHDTIRAICLIQSYVIFAGTSHKPVVVSNPENWSDWSIIIGMLEIISCTSHTCTFTDQQNHLVEIFMAYEIVQLRENPLIVGLEY